VKDLTGWWQVRELISQNANEEQGVKDMSEHDLMLEYTVGGGRPPASSELMQIHRDGRATYLVGNAFPRDEAGLYQMKLSPLEMHALNNFLSEQDLFEMPEEFGPLRSDSGFQTLILYAQNTAKKIRWGTFAKLPGPLAEMQSLLIGIIENSRQHPVQAIKITLHAVQDKIGAGKTIQVECSLQSWGNESVQVFMLAMTDVQEPDFRLYAATSEEAENASPLTFYDQAQPLEFIEPIESRFASPIRLSPGEEIDTRALCPFVLNPDNYRLHGFFEFSIAVTLNDDHLKLRCFVMAKTSTLVS
jgi:hypothetical protein